MVDSVAVLPPGWRALDANGDPFTDAVISFFDAGTSDALEVFSDSGLSTSLGTTVDCNAGGEPVTSGNVPTLIYTGTDPYKVTISSVLAGFTRTFDNVKGALDTSSFLTSAAVADQSVVNISANRSITTADKGKLINVNCSGGVLTMTFDAAATLEDGFFVGIRHAGTANQVKITGNGTNTFGIPGVSPTGFSLTGRGHTVWISCDGANFVIDSECPPLIGATTGIILVADRLSTPPGSPNPGARYIVGSAPTGAWSGFAEHDIAEADGFGTWFNYTPATDCGWIAYVQDEDVNYQFRGSAWVSYTASDAIAGFIEIATQAEQEAATDVQRAVTPGRQHFHPGHPKAGGNFNGSGTPAFRSGDYGMGSITDGGTGNYTLALDTAFADTNYWASGFGRDTAGSTMVVVTTFSSDTKTSSSFQVRVFSQTSGTSAAVDSTEVGVNFWGDYA